MLQIGDWKIDIECEQGCLWLIRFVSNVNKTFKARFDIDKRSFIDETPLTEIELGVLNPMLWSIILSKINYVASSQVSS